MQKGQESTQYIYHAHTHTGPPVRHIQCKDLLLTLQDFIRDNESRAFDPKEMKRELVSGMQMH